MALLLIRHGETVLNASRVVQFPDTPLGQTGLDQAEQLGRSLSARRIGLVLTSDYARAHTTASHVARHSGAELIEVPTLRERNFGNIRGKSYDEFADIDIFAKDYVPPGGESWSIFDRRVDSAWNTVIEHADRISGDLAVVTHGLVLRSLLERRLDVSAIELEEEIVVANTSVTVVDPKPPWRVHQLANTAHLDDGPNDVAAV